MKITWNTDVNAPCCPGEIVAEDGRSILIQSDWDFPSVARNFGWDMRQVQKYKRKDFDYFAECGIWACEECKTVFYPMELEENGICPDCGEKVILFEACEHDSTDGSVNCRQCGLKAGDFMAAAYDWLRDNDGETADDPGYFLE